MQIAVQRVPTDADDLDRVCRQDIAVTGVRADRDSLPDRILMWPIVFGEFPIHDDDELVGNVVGLIEIASVNQRNADGFEIIADDMRRRSDLLLGTLRIDIAVCDKGRLLADALAVRNRNSLSEIGQVSSGFELGW